MRAVSPSSHERRRRVRNVVFACLSVAVLFSAIAFVVARFTRPPQLLIDARTALDAISSNDPKALYRYSAPEERSERGVGLTEAKFVRLWTELIWPRISQLEWSSRNSYMQVGGHQAVAHLESRTKTGARVPLAAMPFASDSGTGYISCSTYLITAWTVEYLVEHPGEKWTNATAMRLRLRGLAKDRDALRLIGLPGFYFEGPGGGYFSFEVLERRWTQGLAEAGASPSF